MIILIIPCYRFKRTVRKNRFSRAGLLSRPHGKIPLPLFLLTHVKFFTSSLFLFPFILPHSLFSLLSMPFLSSPPPLSLLSLYTSFLSSPPHRAHEASLPPPPTVRKAARRLLAEAAWRQRLTVAAEANSGGGDEDDGDHERRWRNDEDDDGSSGGVMTAMTRTTVITRGGCATMAMTTGFVGFIFLFFRAGGIT